MTLFIDDAFETAAMVQIIRDGIVPGAHSAVVKELLAAAELGPEDAAFLAAGELPALAETHVIVPSVAVVCDGAGTIAMRTPVRPDEVERTDIRLYQASATAELLARATVQPFYGIEPASWIAGDAPNAQVVIVDGAEAAIPPEGGFSEDLIRAWFIMTGQPVVSHVLVVPKAADFEPIKDSMEQVRATAHERRKDLRKVIAERFGVDRERLVEIAAARRWELTPADRRSLMMLIQRGHRGSALPYTWQIGYAGEAAPSETGDAEES